MHEAATIAELRAQLARRERELDAVYRVTSALHACTGLERLVQETLRVAVEVVEARAGSILLHDPEKDCLVFRYVLGERPSITRRCRPTRGSPDGCSAVARESSPLTRTPIPVTTSESTARSATIHRT
jgi:hypothetical protein